MSSFEQLIANSNVASLNTGDVLLVESKSAWIDKVIKFVTRSQFTHTAMLVDIKGSWFVVETKPKSQQYQYQMMPADWWVERNENKDAYIGKMPSAQGLTQKNKHQIESNVKKTLMDPTWSKRPYSFTWLAIVYVLQEWCGIRRPAINKNDEDKSKQPMICSTMIQEIWENAGVIEKGNYKSTGDIAELAGGVKSLSPIDLTKIRHSRNLLKNSIPTHNLSA